MALENEKDCLITLKKLIKGNNLFYKNIFAIFEKIIHFLALFVLADDNELKEFELNDTFLLHFIRGRKYNATKAFETVSFRYFLKSFKILK